MPGKAWARRRAGLLLTILAAALAGRATAQDSQSDFLNLGRPQDIAARPMALGGSYTAVASDASALYYNAAGLSAVKKHELSLSLERTDFQADDKADGFPASSLQMENLRLQSFTWLIPIPTERGGLAFALGYYRPRSFDDLAGYQDAGSAAKGNFAYRAEGNLGNYRAAMAVDLAPDLSFGLAMGFVSGEERIRETDSVEIAELRGYSGLNLEPSLMFKISPRLRAGLSLVLWEDILNLKDEYEEKGGAGYIDHYEASYPFQVKSGIAYQGNTFLLAADAHWNAFSQYSYGFKDEDAREKAHYKDEWILSAGAEKFIPAANTVLRAGYTWNNWPQSGYASTYAVNRLSAGLGFLFSGSLSLDLAYSYSFWGLARDGVTYDNREQRALVTMAFRY